MNINVLLTEQAFSPQYGNTAIRFVQAALAAGHTISQVFFYQSSVMQANQLAVLLDDEFNPLTHWSALAQQHGIELVVCVSAAERRGVVGVEQQNEHSLVGSSLHPDFKIAGLGALHEAALTADRMVTF